MNGVRRLFGTTKDASQSSSASTMPQISNPSPITPLSSTGKIIYAVPPAPIQTNNLNGVGPGPSTANMVSPTTSPASPGMISASAFAKGGGGKMRPASRKVTDDSMRMDAESPISVASSSTPPPPMRSSTTPLSITRKRSVQASTTPTPPIRSYTGASSSSQISAAQIIRSPSPPRHVTLQALNPEWKNASSLVNTRDELLISLLSSEAVLDSREYAILGSEEVEELKNEHILLTSRIGALTKKLSLETKIRDAAQSLHKLNSSHKRMSKPTSDQLDAANRKVDAAQRELSRVQARGSEIYRQLLEHRSAVLSFSVQRLEKKHSADGDPDDSDSATATFSGDLSPTSTTATSVSISSRTKFEGAHLFAGHADAVTPRKLKAPPSMAQMTQLEEQLKVSKKKEADMTRELTMVNLERNELETRLGLDLQAAEDTISSLRAEVQRVEEMESEIRELRQRVRNQEAELMDYEEGKGNDAKVMELQSAWDRERAEWERERATVGGGGGWAKEKQRLEDDLNFEAETREGLEKDLEAAKAEIRALEGRVKDTSDRFASLAQKRISSPMPAYNGSKDDPEYILLVLRKLWSSLPSAEGRLAKLGGKHNTGSSIGDLDIKALRSHFDNRTGFNSPTVTGEFSVDAFAEKVKALLADDKAIVDRLIRFAQAHELLKSNAERAQKLAQDSSVALETYQKQVKTLEERNAAFTARQASLSNEMRQLTDALELAIEQKRQLEIEAAEQGATSRTLQDSNDKLSARTLTLAADAARAAAGPEARVVTLEARVKELEDALKSAQDDLENMRNAEQSQRITLLDELNSMQTEIGNLKNQLKAEQQKKK